MRVVLRAWGAVEIVRRAAAGPVVCACMLGCKVALRMRAQAGPSTAPQILHFGSAARAGRRAVSGV